LPTACRQGHYWLVGCCVCPDTPPVASCQGVRGYCSLVDCCVCPDTPLVASCWGSGGTGQGLVWHVGSAALLVIRGDRDAVRGSKNWRLGVVTFGDTFPGGRLVVKGLGGAMDLNVLCKKPRIPRGKSTPVASLESAQLEVEVIHTEASIKQPVGSPVADQATAGRPDKWGTIKVKKHKSHRDEGSSPMGSSKERTRGLGGGLLSDLPPTKIDEGPV
ncbi:hypothetical protein BHE74_00056416, partial [Ensete ventricosum]